jgi:hypothetical protein
MRCYANDQSWPPTPRARDAAPSGLPTARNYVWLHSVTAICVRCDRHAPLDLTAVIAAGRGDVPLIKLPLWCSACGDGAMVSERTASQSLSQAQFGGRENDRPGSSNPL